MKNKLQLFVSILACALLLAAGPLCSVVEAQEGLPTDGHAGAKNFGGSSPLTIPAAAFATKGNNAESTTFIWYNGYLKGNANPGGCVQAPVYVPAYSEVYQLWASFIDQDGSNDATVILTRISNWGGGPDVMGQLTTSDTGATPSSFSDTSIDHRMVSPDYSYYVTTCLPSDSIRLFSVRIWYHEDAIFMDGFERSDMSMWSTVVN